MATSELSTGKTIFVLTVVAGCFAVLWPKIFYPMFFGSPQYLNNLEKAQGIQVPGDTGCCDVIFEKDIQTLKILTQLCEESVVRNPSPKLSQSALLNLCYQQLQETCNIDLSPLYKMSARHEFDSSFKKFLGIVRSYNSSLCLKDHYHVNLNLIGTPHIIKSTVMKATSLINVKNDHGMAKPQMRQERPPHLRPEILHPALRENGRTIPHEHVVPRVEPDVPPRPVIKTGVPKPGMGGRPSFGGAGAHQGGAKQGGGIMTLLMPMYTVSIVAFFIYTMLRIWDPMVLFVKLVLQFISNSSNNARQSSVPQHDYYSETEIRSSYYDETLPYSVAGSGRRQLDDSKAATPADKGGKLVVSAITGLLEQVNREILDTHVEGSGCLADPSQDGVKADKPEAEPSPIPPEVKPSSSEVPSTPQVTSSLFPSRQNSILEVEVHGYEDVKQVLDRQRQQKEGGERKSEARNSNGLQEIEKIVENDVVEDVEKLSEDVCEEIVKKEIVPVEMEREESIKQDEVDEEIIQKELVPSVEEKVKQLTDPQEELIKENIAKISEELNKTIIGEYELERTHPKNLEEKYEGDISHKDAIDFAENETDSLQNEEFSEQSRKKDEVDVLEKDLEDVSESSTLHDEKSEGNSIGCDVNRSDTKAKPIVAEETAIEEELDARAVQVINMERTESLVGGQKYAPRLPDAPPLAYPSRPLTPEVPQVTPPHRIILDGLLPESSQILVADELTETESVTTEDGESDSDSVVLSSKVTLSLIPAGREEHMDEGPGERVESSSELTQPASLQFKEPNGVSSRQRNSTATRSDQNKNKRESDSESEDEQETEATADGKTNGDEISEHDEVRRQNETTDLSGNKSKQVESNSDEEEIEEDGEEEIVETDVEEDEDGVEIEEYEDEEAGDEELEDEEVEYEEEEEVDEDGQNDSTENKKQK